MGPSASQAEAAIDAREIECAVLGNDEPEASVCGEIIVTHRDGFYSYDAKYVDPDGAGLRIPADISPDPFPYLDSFSPVISASFSHHNGFQTLRL